MSRFTYRCMLACLVLGAGRPCLAGGKAADLAFVPPDAVGFLHVRLADIWKSDHFKEWRGTVLKAGEKVLDAFDRRFFPAPSSLDRVTIFALAGAQQNDHPVGPFVIIATSRAIDREGFLKNTVPGARMEKIPVSSEKTGEGTIFVDAKKRTEIYFLNDRNFVVGPAGAVRKLLSRPRVAGNLTPALELARSGKALVAALNGEKLPPMALRGVPFPFQPILKAKLATASLDLAKDGRVDLALDYPAAAQAEDAETAVQKGLQLARGLLAKQRGKLEEKVLGTGKPGTLEELPEAAGALFGVGMLNRLEEFLDSVPVKKEGTALAVSVKLPQGSAGVFSIAAMGSALLVPAVQKVREASVRTQSANNLKQLMLAMHNYHDVYKKLPSAAICDPAGKPLLSWRVAILPFIEQDALYRKFKLDEPWDSEHNRRLIPLMPVTYMHPSQPIAKSVDVPPGKSFTGEGNTHYRVFVGGGAGFEWAKGVRLFDITDGTSNTIAIVEAAQSVPWTKPEELVYDVKKALPRLADFQGDGTFQAAFFDGSVRTLRLDMPEAILRALITRAGGEVATLDK